MIASSGGLAGAHIRIDGLKQTTTDALVRVRLSEGAVHRVVLRPSETSTTIPNPQNSMDEKKKNHAWIWPYSHLEGIHPFEFNT